MTNDADDFIDFIDFINNSFDDDMSEKKERRKCIRLEGRFPARVQDEECVVLNISEKGIMLEIDLMGQLFPLETIIDLELNLKEQWIPIKGKVMWIQSDSMQAQIGLFIEHASEPYFQFLREFQE